jgi:hypothetical protein
MTNFNSNNGTNNSSNSNNESYKVLLPYAVRVLRMWS